MMILGITYKRRQSLHWLMIFRGEVEIEEDVNRVSDSGAIIRIVIANNYFNAK